MSLVHKDTQGTPYTRTDSLPRWRTVGEDGQGLPAGAGDELLLCEGDGARAIVLMLYDANRFLEPGDRWVPWADVSDLLALPGGET